MSENPVNSRTGDEMSPGGAVINWDRIIHKNVRTADNQGMGKVIAVPNNEDTVIISSQSSDAFYKVPRSMVAGFNGAEVQLGVTSGSMATYHVEDASAYEAQPSDVVTEQGERKAREDETSVPVVEERLRVSKKKTTEEGRITKEPLVETKTVEVPLTHEKLVVERRAASSASTTERPVESQEEITVPLQKEQIEVSKEPYVREEVVVKKKPVTETKQVKESVTSEKVDVHAPGKSRKRRK